MKRIGIVVLILLVALAFGAGQQASEEVMTLAIVAVVGMVAMVFALLGFIVYSGVRETQAWASRPTPPAPPTVVYPPQPALPQGQQPIVIVLAPQGEQPPRYVIMPQQLGQPQTRPLAAGVVEGESRELFYPRSAQ
jgi:hypothetical protein